MPKCATCGKNFKNDWGLSVHTNMLHKNVGVTRDTKKFKNILYDIISHEPQSTISTSLLYKKLAERGITGSNEALNQRISKAAISDSRIKRLERGVYQAVVNNEKSELLSIIDEAKKNMLSSSQSADDSKDSLVPERLSVDAQVLMLTHQLQIIQAKSNVQQEVILGLQRLLSLAVGPN